MTWIYIIGYLAAIVAANLIVAWQGAWITPYTAFLFIGLDLTVKDQLQDRWTRNGLVWRMGLLISAGSFLSWLLNRRAGRIAVASFAAFAVSTVIDTLIYAVVKGEKWRKVGWSNLGGAISDSLVFPSLAFGWPPDPAIVYGQAAAKLAGGLFWSLILIR
jgi:hypothetical protein